MTDTDPRHLEIALYHANHLQQLKDLELQIWDNIEKLIDYPLSPYTTPEDPQSDDIEQVTELLQPFRQTDYEELVGERRGNDHCAYLLCPKRTPKPKGGGKKLIFHKNGPVEAIPWDLYLTFCSPACKERSNYLLSQINLKAPWERKGAVTPLEYLVGKDTAARQTIKYDPAQTAAVNKMTDKFSNMEMNASQDKSLDELMSSLVIEKDTIKPPTVPKPDAFEQTHDSIEGYRPGAGVSLKKDDPLSFLD